MIGLYKAELALKGASIDFVKINPAIKTKDLSG